MGSARHWPAEEADSRWLIQPWPLLCLVIGLASAVEFQLIGRILGTEVLGIMLLLGLTIFNRLPVPDRLTTLLMGLAVVWLVAQFISDLVNHSSYENMLRGLARAFITIIQVYVFHILIAGQRRRLHFLFVGLAFGFLFNVLFNLDDFDDADIWKFGFGTPVTMLCVVVTSWLWYRRLRLLSVLPTLAIGVLNLYLGFRNMAGCALIVALVQTLLILFGTRRIMLFAPVAILGLVGIVPFYGLAAERGWLGQEQQERYLSQISDYGILLSGRLEWRVAPIAFLDKPLTGHGSWAEDDRYAQMYWEMFSGSTDLLPSSFSSLIPSHSHLMGALVEGGIFSGLFWIIVLLLLARSLVTLVRNPGLIDPIILFILVLLGWAVLFSPYGLNNRVFACYGIAVVTYLLEQARQASQRRNAVRPVT